MTLSIVSITPGKARDKWRLSRAKDKNPTIYVLSRVTVISARYLLMNAHTGGLRRKRYMTNKDDSLSQFVIGTVTSSSKQEEIREGVARMFWAIQLNETGLMIAPADWDKVSPEGREFLITKADEILAYLHSQGVAIKVERELPDLIAPTEEDERGAHCGHFSDHQWYYAGQGKALEQVTKARLTAWEPLIEEIPGSD